MSNVTRATDDYLLEVNNLETQFTTESGVVKAVDNVSFKLKKGQTIGIVGESGSGKSVTSLSLMRLIPSPPGKITAGEMLFNSRKYGKVDLRTVPEKQMRDIRGNEISMIFQEPMTSLNPVYTCGNQVMEAILLHQKVNKKTAKQITLDLFERVKLPRPEAIFKAYPHEISGGQKQRVMIAMAMSCNPQVLIADEPTTALDVTVQARILNLMRDLRDEIDASIVFITHDLGVIAEIADYVMVMYQGKVVEQGTVLDIFSNPQHPYTKGLLACRPRTDVKLKLLPTVSDFMEVDSKGEICEKKNKFKTLEDIVKENVVSEWEMVERANKLVEQEPLLVVKNLKKYYPIKKNFRGKVLSEVKAVDDVSFEVYPGETVGLVGESGCGKTTLGRTIMHLTEATSGEVIFEGVNVAHYTGEQLRQLRKDIQFIFQDPYSSLNPRRTIGNAIIEPMRVHGILDSDFSRKKRVIELLEKVNLNASHFERYPHEFSGGQRQRISIARALALNPKFIICDESVSALDVSVQAQVLNLLNELKNEYNFTYIFISHDLSVVKFMSDRLIVMNQGKIVESGFAEEVYKNPQNEYTKYLIEAIPKGDLEKIREEQAKRKGALQT